MAIQTKIQLCVLPKFDENHHVISGVAFTPEVRMKHVDRRWKAYPVGNKGGIPRVQMWCYKVLVVFSMDKLVVAWKRSSMQR